MSGRRSLTLALAMIAMIGTASETYAERLAVRRYTTADGLAGDYIVSIYRDSRGFVWFSTREGLARFDGVHFTNYGVADGLPTTVVNYVLETRSGVYWVGTNGGGLCRFNPRGRRPAPAELTTSQQAHPVAAEDLLFTRYQVADEPGTNRINVLFEDHTGDVWIGTDLGLFRLHSDGGRVDLRRMPLALLPSDVTLHGVHAIVEDGEGSLWIGGGWGLTRRLPDGRTVLYRVQPQGARDRVQALLLDRDKRLWVASGNGLTVLNPDSAAAFAGANAPLERTIVRMLHDTMRPAGTSSRDGEMAYWYTTANGLPHDSAGALFQSANGHVWIGTFGGLSEFDGKSFRPYRTLNGLVGNYTTAIEDDSAGNLWVGTVEGVTRILPHGLISYDEADGFRSSRVHALGEDASGHLLVLSADYLISRFDGRRFASMRADVPSDAACMWMSPCGYLDRDGEWWVLTTAGLYRFTKASQSGDGSRPPSRARYATGSGLPADNVFNAFEDRDGNLWVATAPAGLARWQRSTDTWRAFSEAEATPPSRGMLNMATAFAQDAAGDVWVAFHDSGLSRFRSGRFELFGTREGVPPGVITALHVDSSGRLWVGSNQGGLAHADDPGAAHPTFASLPSYQGLNVRCLIEDRQARIYAGTSRGVIRIDPRSGRLERFGMGEGLASEFVTAAFRDSKGMLWFGTITGVSRLDPSAHLAAAAGIEPAPVHISALRVRGVAQRLSELGETDPKELTLAPDQNQLEIGFFSLAFSTAEPVKYQYRIEDVDADWSPPTELRSVNYGRLPSGSHRFLVRSVHGDGTVSSNPAVVAFTVLPPVYARWWFVSLGVLITGLAALALYRMRVAQLLRVERVRARIATDLHDDIGASLSQIAILAEVAQQRPEHHDQDPVGPLARIAETSRGLVDSMSDIVWAINPDVDSVSDLVHRIRRFAEDTLSGDDIELTFHEPDLRQDPRLGPEIRREIFLVLKEIVTNIAKHAGCTRVTIDLETDRRRLRLRVSDDGRGFDPAQRTDGNGVANMQRRVAALGGRIGIQSRPGRGTNIELEVQL